MQDLACLSSKYSRVELHTEGTEANSLLSLEVLTRTYLSELLPEGRMFSESHMSISGDEKKSSTKEVNLTGLLLLLGGT